MSPIKGKKSLGTIQFGIKWDKDVYQKMEIDPCSVSDLDSPFLSQVSVTRPKKKTFISE